MTIKEIEQLPEVKEAARVLKALERYGIKEPAIAAGWTRTLIAGGSTSDIDVSYVGEIHFNQAQTILENVLDDLEVANRSMWDVKGIWNAEIAYGVKHTVDNYLLYYLNSIDSVYLAADGKLHDPTGFGFKDAKTKTLRINEYDLKGRTPTASEEVNVCLENCRRIAKFSWSPTSRSVDRITAGVAAWNELAGDEKRYFLDKLRLKYPQKQRRLAKASYIKYGWGFVFDTL